MDASTAVFIGSQMDTSKAAYHVKYREAYRIASLKIHIHFSTPAYLDIYIDASYTAYMIYRGGPKKVLSL
jgi:hypothetical protein